MRQSPLHSAMQNLGARFGERYGKEIAVACDEHAVEYARIRDAVGITDFSFTNIFRIPEEAALDYLDTLFAGNIARIRFGRALHTFLADENGRLTADCYIANNDEEFILICESIVDDAALRKALASAVPADAGLENLNESHVVISIDGYKAWAVVRELFGPDVLGLPYLSIESYEFDSRPVQLLRGGKTSEFGYLALAPVESGEKLMDALVRSARDHGGGACGLAIHDDLRLEGRFFNIFAEGAAIGDPLPLGLQWMIDLEKDQFSGRDVIMARRAEGVKTKIVGLRAEAPGDRLRAGSPLYDGDEKVGTVVAACHSYALDAEIGLGILPTSMAFAGVPLRADSPEGAGLHTISMPPILPKSLTVKLDEI